MKKKLKNRYISLGCSLTAQTGYIKFLIREYGLDITNLAVSAGSNQLQQHRLNNLYVKNQINLNTILLWQITFPLRSHALIDYDEFAETNSSSEFFDNIRENVELFQSSHYALLTHNPYFQKIHVASNYNENLQNLTIDIMHWSFLCKKIIVYLGWDFMEKKVYKTFLNFLKRRPNILVLPQESNIVDWCKNNNLEFSDDLHPTEESYIQWAKSNLIPVLGLTSK